VTVRAVRESGMTGRLEELCTVDSEERSTYRASANTPSMAVTPCLATYRHVV